MKVKICGLRRVEDAQVAIELGATHLGVVLAHDSPRCATTEQARAIVRLARGVTPVVLVFRHQDDATIRAACDAIGSQRVQVHGADAPRCAALSAAGLQPMPVLQIEPGVVQLPALAPPPSEEAPALLDGGRGGAGQCFRWSLLGEKAPAAVFVGGGIRPDNVRQLLQYQPWGIDVSSGVEREPGAKDPVLMNELMAVVRLARRSR